MDEAVVGGDLRSGSTVCLHRREEPARRGAGFRTEPRHDCQDVPPAGESTDPTSGSNLAQGGRRKSTIFEDDQTLVQSTSTSNFHLSPQNRFPVVSVQHVLSGTIPENPSFLRASAIT